MPSFLLILCLGVLQTAGAVTRTVPSGPQTAQTPVTADLTTQGAVTLPSGHHTNWTAFAVNVTTQGLPIVVQTDISLEVFKTNSVVLGCQLDPVDAPNLRYQVSWYKISADGSSGSAFITSVHDQDVHEEERQKQLGLAGRVSIQPDGRSLNITDVFLHDEGTYRCEVTVHEPFLAKASSDVLLTVVDYQILGYSKNMVVEKGTPVTLTAMVSGSKLPAQNSWKVNGEEPLNNSVFEVTSLRQDRRWMVTNTFIYMKGTTATVTFESNILLASAEQVIMNDNYNNSRTVVVSQTVSFREFCDCRVASFAVAEAGCTIAGAVLVMILFTVHVKTNGSCEHWCCGYMVLVTLFLGVVIGIPVNFFAVQKVRMNAGSIVVIVFAALTPIVIHGVNLCLASSSLDFYISESDPAASTHLANQDQRPNEMVPPRGRQPQLHNRRASPDNSYM